MGNRNLSRVLHEDAHRRFVQPGLNQPTFNRKRPNTCKYIAAVLRITDAVFIDKNLQEKVIDVDTGVLGRGNNSDLGRQRIPPADAINLARIEVSIAEQ